MNHQMMFVYADHPIEFKSIETMGPAWSSYKLNFCLSFFSQKLGGGFKYFLCSPLLGEDSHFDYIIFFKGVETTN